MEPTFDSPFYRVTAKALILDDQQRLLVLQTAKEDIELPGGGWNHDESFEDCMKREIKEELGVETESVGLVKFFYRGQNKDKGFATLRIAATVTLAGGDFNYGSDMKDSRSITREEFMKTDFSLCEGDIGQYADLIWSS